MTIACVCPVCSARFPIEAGIADGQARQAIQCVANLPAPLGDLVIGYFGLFAPKGKATAWRKVARIAGELVELIRADQVRFGPRALPVSPDLWRAALEAVLERRDKLDLPLKNHNYLLAIIAPEAERRAGRADAERERQTEAERRHRRDDGTRSGGPTPLGKLLETAAARESIDAAKDIIGGKRETR